MLGKNTSSESDPHTYRKLINDRDIIKIKEKRMHCFINDATTILGPYGKKIRFLSNIILKNIFLVH